MVQNNITLIPGLVHTQVFWSASNKLKITSPEAANCTLFSSVSRERTYRCLVDVVHVGGSSAACPDGVLAQRKEVMSSSGQDAGLVLGGFYSRSPELLWSLPGRTGLPTPPSGLCLGECVCVCVSFGQSVTITRLR